MEGCGKIKDCGGWGIRRCGNFEDLKHSDHYIYCLDCISNLPISLCKSCMCMTKTINKRCGKCKAVKSIKEVQENKDE